MGLAYLDPEFLASDEARPLRIIAEYLDPLRRLRRQCVHDTIVFFGSARLAEEGPLGRYYTEARELARLITAWSSGLSSNLHRFVICSGGGGGIMEAANRGARDAGGRTIGLNISLPHEQQPNRFVTPELLFKFRYFFMRKLWFAHLARAMVVFPGASELWMNSWKSSRWRRLRSWRASCRSSYTARVIGARSSTLRLSYAMG